MNIGDAARQPGLPTKTIRYYEDINLEKPQRASNGYQFLVGCACSIEQALCRYSGRATRGRNSRALRQAGNRNRSHADLGGLSICMADYG